MAEKDWIQRYFAPLATPGARKMKDDAALLADSTHIVTTDALVEGVHFLKDRPLSELAKKLVRVNVSDLLSKGARPIEALLTLGWSSDGREHALSDFAEGLSAELRAWNIGLVGGDTVTSPVLFVSLTLIGLPISQTRGPIWQAGAKRGDLILLSGPIGGAIGLEHAQEQRDTLAASHYFVPKIPALSAAEFVSQHATSSTDVSDGLLSDVNKLVEQSEFGAEIELKRIRLWEETKDLKRIIYQCTGGDDYQIACTVPKLVSPDVIKNANFYPIGEITEEASLKISFNGNAMELPDVLGFEHGD